MLHDGMSDEVSEEMQERGVNQASVFTWDA